MSVFIFVFVLLGTAVVVRQLWKATESWETKPAEPLIHLDHPGRPHKTDCDGSSYLYTCYRTQEELSRHK